MSNTTKQVVFKNNFARPVLTYFICINKNDKEVIYGQDKKNLFRPTEKEVKRLHTAICRFGKRRAISPAFNYCENDLTGEIWKTFPLDENYTVSNLGRIKYKGQIQKQKDEKTGYVTLSDKSLRKDYIYNFVAYTFLGKIEGDGMHVHHITNDGYYNTTENLVLLTKDEHSYVHGFEIGVGK